VSVIARPPPGCDHAPRFRPGERVRVRNVYSPGHIRTPHYVRGKSGRVERFVGFFRNPEELAYGRSGLPAQALYRVRFAQQDVWPDYTGAAGDTIDIDLYEHWLQPEDAP
jgi:nitrile hydratase subunit beta